MSSMITLVPPEDVDSWTQTASSQQLSPFISIESVSRGMTGPSPSFGWHNVKADRRMEIWVVADMEMHEPVHVSHVAMVQEAASRSHGTYVPVNKDIPEEYNPQRTTRTCDFTTKMYWALQSKKHDTSQIGFHMKEIERKLYDALEGAFYPTELSISELRSSWNAPDASDVYYIEHPVVANHSVADYRGTVSGNRTLHPYILQGIREYRDVCRTNGRQYRELVEVQGRPDVLYKNGSHHDAAASVMECVSDEDYHREGDIVWFGGSIWAIVNVGGRRKSWTTEFWPDAVIRIAKQKMEPPKKRRHMDLKAVDFKRRRSDMPEMPSPPKSMAFRSQPAPQSDMNIVTSSVPDSVSTPEMSVLDMDTEGDSEAASSVATPEDGPILSMTPTEDAPSTGRKSTGNMMFSKTNRRRRNGSLD